MNASQLNSPFNSASEMTEDVVFVGALVTVIVPPLVVVVVSPSIDGIFGCRDEGVVVIPVVVAVVVAEVVVVVVGASFFSSKENRPFPGT